MSVDTATWYEFLSTVLAFFGFIYAAANSIEAYRDWQVIRGLIPPDTRHVIAWQELRVEAGRAVSLVGFFILGLISMMWPTRDTSVYTVTIFLVIESIMVVNSVLNNRVRRRLMAWIKMPPNDSDDTQT